MGITQKGRFQIRRTITADRSVQEKIAATKEQISLLPKGSVGQKTADGKKYLPVPDGKQEAQGEIHPHSVNAEEYVKGAG